MTVNHVVTTASATLMVAVVLLAAPAAHAALPGRNGQLAVSVSISRGDCGEVIDCVDQRIRLVDATSGRARTLATCVGRDCDDSEPAWFPDGSRLAFSRDTRGVSDTFSVRPNGSDLERMGGGGGGQAWSPDGTRLAYAQQVAFVARREIWISDLSGDARHRLTRGDDAVPAWSSRDRIAFVRRVRRSRGFFNIYVVHADGSGLRRVTRGFDLDPNWSPDGRSIVFSRQYQGRERARDDLAVVSAAGGPVRRLTGAGGTMPVWSPDGRRIAFVRGRSLMSMSLQTRRVRTLLRLPRFRSFTGIDWQPLP